MSHTFYIPVLGLGFSVDTPVKVARFGISSVISIVDDMLVERMREFYTGKRKEKFVPIGDREPDSRARRITAYLNLVNQIVREDFELLRNSAFAPHSEITRYFDLLPEASALKLKYRKMLASENSDLKFQLQEELTREMVCGSIDVNIMSKVDKLNFSAGGNPLKETFSDALAALRGFAQSDLRSSVVFSAGMNPRLYGYLEQFPCFYPSGNRLPEKKIILKVSDFRSAFIQARFLAKKGLWVSEFRIESGLNCGGHAFATEGFLLGPVLEEFKIRRQEMFRELYSLYKSGLEAKGIRAVRVPEFRLGVQGGIGTAAENAFLRDHYQMDATGWGSPFLLVPEATNVDEETIRSLVKASRDDFYISGSSPLGVPFNNFRNSSAETQRLERIARNRPGAPCTKKYLVSNTEFTDKPICVASREYQRKKIEQIKSFNLSESEYEAWIAEITEKTCLCEGLSASVYRKNDMLKPRENKAVAICPGPNLAYFSGIFSLEQMVKHIYGKLDLLSGIERPNMFINELKLYIDYLKKDSENCINSLNDKKSRYLDRFRQQLQKGVDYYKELIPRMSNQTESYLNKMSRELWEAETNLALVSM